MTKKESGRLLGIKTQQPTTDKIIVIVFLINCPD